MKATCLTCAVLGSNPGVYAVADEGHIQRPDALIQRPDALLSGDHVVHVDAASYPELAWSTSTSVHAGGQL